MPSWNETPWRSWKVYVAPPLEEVQLVASDGSMTRLAVPGSYLTRPSYRFA